MANILSFTDCLRIVSWASAVALYFQIWYFAIKFLVECVSLSFAVGKMKLHNCCPPGNNPFEANGSYYYFLIQRQELFLINADVSSGTSSGSKTSTWTTAESFARFATSQSPRCTPTTWLPSKAWSTSPTALTWSCWSGKSPLSTLYQLAEK